MGKRKRKGAFSNFSSGVSSAYDMGKKALRIANEVKQLLNVEFKYHETVISAQDGDFAGVVTDLFDAAQEDAQGTRDGDQVKAKRIVVRGSFVGGTQSGGNRVRLMLVKTVDGSTPTGASVLDGSIGGTNAVLAHKNYSNRKNNRVLWDRTFFVDNATGAGPARKLFKINIPLNDVVLFDAGTGTSTANGFYLLHVADIAAGVGVADLSAVSRIYYVDN